MTGEASCTQIAAIHHTAGAPVAGAWERMGSFVFHKKQATDFVFQKQAFVEHKAGLEAGVRLAGHYTPHSQSCRALRSPF
jgi:hypothetical protein